MAGASRWITLGLLALAIDPARAFTRTGTSAAVFLKLPVSARVAALGGAGLALDGAATGTAEGLMINPASLAGIRGPGLALGQQRWLGELEHGVAAYRAPLGAHAGWGLGLNWLTVPDQQITTVEQPAGTGTDYGYGDLALTLSGGWRLNERLSAGLCARYLRQSLYNEEAEGLSADLALQVDIPWHKTRLAVALMHYGTRMELEGEDLLILAGDGRLARLETQDFAQPLLFRLGLAGQLWQGNGQQLDWTLQAEHPTDHRRNGGLGLEYTLRRQVALRVGRRIHTDLESWTAGLGLRATVPGTALEATVDAAWLATRHFDNPLLFSLGLAF
jgi:hypothetical protein